MRLDLLWRNPVVREWLRLVPSLRLVLLLGPFALLWTGVSAGVAGWLCQTRHWATPYTRKVFHFLIFSMAAVLHVAAGLPAVMLYGSICAVAVLYSLGRGPGFFFYEAIARPTDDPHRSLFVLIPLATTAVGGLFSSIVFGPLAAVGYLVGGWGDAMGEPVGTRWGDIRSGCHRCSGSGPPAVWKAAGRCSFFPVWRRLSACGSSGWRVFLSSGWRWVSHSLPRSWRRSAPTALIT